MREQLPGPVRWARILMFVLAGLMFTWSAVAVLSSGFSAAAVAAVPAVSLPGVAQLVLGLLVRRRGGAVLAAIVLVQAFCAASTLLTADHGGALTQLVLPAAVAVLALTRTSRDYFLRS